MFEQFNYAQLEAIVRHQLVNNEFLSGGLVVVIFGSIMAQLRNIPSRMLNWVDRMFHTTMVLDRDDNRFYDVLNWLSNHDRAMGRARHLRPTSMDGSSSFGEGTTWFFYQYRLVIVSLDVDRSSNTGELANRQTLNLRFWGRSHHVVRNLMNDVMEDARRREEESGTPSMYMYGLSSGADEWRFQGRSPKRNIDSVILKRGQMGAIRDRIQQFIDAESWYRDMGIPHRLGMCLEGPPGTGKTSIVRALCSEFDAKIHILSLSHPRLNDTTLQHLCSDVGDDEGVSAIVIEDVDAIFHSSDRGEETKSQITLSGLLNALDGISTGYSRLMFMTTNHKIRLDAALLRPGRVDVQVHVGNLDYDQAYDMFVRFFPDSDRGAHEFATTFNGQSSAASQQELIELAVPMIGAKTVVGV